MEILSYSFFQNALLGVLFVSIAAGIIGTYVVSRRMVFITGGITHACFGGLGLGFFLGINPIAMAAVFAIAAATGVEWMSTRQNVRQDSAIGVIWALGMALGTLFIFLSPGYVPELTSFLFGNVLTITSTDIILFAAYLVVLLAFFAVFYPQILLCAFDPDFAATRRLRVSVINLAMTIMIAICIVLTIRLIGIMLLLSLLTMPQMIAEMFTNRFHHMMIISSLVSIACSVLGIFCSYWIAVPASATIVLTLVAAYAMARIIRIIKAS
ncbi:MAG: metal ABC transporter permease [bacterium]|nr:metal ABC transporter permease [bacterium]MDD6026953.1 metal ABC transporter permease [bacterium]